MNNKFRKFLTFFLIMFFSCTGKSNALAVRHMNYTMNTEIVGKVFRRYIDNIFNKNHLIGKIDDINCYGKFFSKGIANIQNDQDRKIFLSKILNKLIDILDDSIYKEKEDRKIAILKTILSIPIINIMYENYKKDEDIILELMCSNIDLRDIVFINIAKGQVSGLDKKALKIFNEYLPKSKKKHKTALVCNFICTIQKAQEKLGIKGISNFIVYDNVIKDIFKKSDVKETQSLSLLLQSQFSEEILDEFEEIKKRVQLANEIVFTKQIPAIQELKKIIRQLDKKSEEDIDKEIRLIWNALDDGIKKIVCAKVDLITGINILNKLASKIYSKNKINKKESYICEIVSYIMMDLFMNLEQDNNKNETLKYFIKKEINEIGNGLNQITRKDIKFLFQTEKNEIYKLISVWRLLRIFKIRRKYYTQLLCKDNLSYKKLKQLLNPKVQLVFLGIQPLNSILHRDDFSEIKKLLPIGIAFKKDLDKNNYIVDNFHKQFKLKYNEEFIINKIIDVLKKDKIIKSSMLDKKIKQEILYILKSGKEPILKEYQKLADIVMHYKYIIDEIILFSAHKDNIEQYLECMGNLCQKNEKNKVIIMQKFKKDTMDRKNICIINPLSNNPFDNVGCRKIYAEESMRNVKDIYNLFLESVLKYYEAKSGFSIKEFKAFQEKKSIEYSMKNLDVKDCKINLIKFLLKKEYRYFRKYFRKYFKVSFYYDDKKLTEIYNNFNKINSKDEGYLNKIKQCMIDVEQMVINQDKAQAYNDFEKVIDKICFYFETKDKSRLQEKFKKFLYNNKIKIPKISFLIRLLNAIGRENILITNAEKVNDLLQYVLNPNLNKNKPLVFSFSFLFNKPLKVIEKEWKNKDYEKLSIAV